MNQFMLFHFTIVKNDRLYQFQVQPNSPWEEIEEIFVEFQEKFKVLKEEAQAKAAQQDAEKPAEVV